MKWQNLLLFPLFGFIQWPFAALVPAVGFAIAGAIRKRLLAGLAGTIWFCYALYEAGMYARLLCSGECNIRVDLLLIYPFLLLISAAALFVFLRDRFVVDFR